MWLQSALFEQLTLIRSLPAAGSITAFPLFCFEKSNQPLSRSWEFSLTSLTFCVSLNTEPDLVDWEANLFHGGHGPTSSAALQAARTRPSPLLEPSRWWGKGASVRGAAELVWNLLQPQRPLSLLQP